jgi:MFS family permease
MNSYSHRGAWLSEPINSRLGRRGAIFLGSGVCLIANILSAISWNWPILLLFRFFLGAGMGINSSTVAVYAAECSPSSIRGGLVVSWQMFTAFGIFVGFVTNVAVYNVRYISHFFMKSQSH